jgi:hypothetical protein
VLAAAVLPLSGGSVALADACPASPTTSPFTAWGDLNGYFLMPGGSFEPGGADPANGWTLNNASITPGNEPFYVGSPTDQQSLTLNSGGSVAVSPWFCLDATMPSFRFFAQEATAGSDLHVTLRLASGTSILGASTDNMIDLQDGSMPTWAATDPLGLAAALSIPPGSSVQAQLVFHVPASGGSWQIDDVYVDPYRVG